MKSVRILIVFVTLIILFIGTMSLFVRAGLCPASARKGKLAGTRLRDSKSFKSRCAVRSAQTGFAYYKLL